MPVALLLLLPLAGCEEGSARGATPATPPTPPPTPTAPAEPGGSGQTADDGGPPATHDPGPGPARPGQGRGGKKVLEGGGFASAVPGSDAPDRTVDVGPQFTISDDVDIAEIERLVEAVERIAKEQADGPPLVSTGDLAAAVGTFSYRWFADGTLAPDPAWVRANIRTESVPILGDVTCHRVMLPQLRGALSEVVARGLASKVNSAEYGGCYVPRFIGRDPKKGLSLHSWGIAVDLNVPGNLRGVPGEIDRTVVAIFKRWGFAWGGDWSWTDPMHFEMNRLVRAQG